MNTKRVGKPLTMLFAGGAALVVTGCTSISMNPVADVMPGANAFKSRVDSITPGDSYEQVLQKLQLEDDEFQAFSSTMDDSIAYEYVYGTGNPPQGTRLEEYDALSGVTVDYKNIKESKRYGFLNTKTKVSGDDLSTVIIFRDGKVMNDPVVSERPVNGRNSDSHLRRIDPLKLVPGL